MLIILGLIAIPVLIAINGYFVAIEFALVSLRKTRVEELVQTNVPGAKSVQKAQGNLDKSIAAAQLGITLASIALGAIGETIFEQMLEPFFVFIGLTGDAFTRHTIATGLSIAFITYLHVILGEQVPKMFAIHAPDRVALWTAGTFNVFSLVTGPILALMNASGHFLLRRLGVADGGHHETKMSVEELRMMVDDTQEAGLLESDQALFVKNVFKLTDKKVRDCMVPADRMDAIELHTKPNKVLDIVRKCGHTRLPVYDGTKENVVGILNTKNLFYFLTLKNVLVLEDALYPAEYINADDPITHALQMFKRTRRPMALVRDKERKLLGLITLEDILEEIVGDIEDEHDEASSPTRRGKTGLNVSSGGESGTSNR
ncbi:hemolysin family protein [Zavarzinella formosa]|uniref:hemolysin family protein n=1 Tax=Zavarzinella formosa TaxID=360055 RepID=UPI000318A912|nr:hemolysin family protein [Zavarzinella formosa]